MFMVLLKNLSAFFLVCFLMIQTMKIASNDLLKMNTDKMTGSGLSHNLRTKEPNPTKNKV